jgi:hypothetical protein
MATVPALTDRTPAQRFAEVRDEESLWGDLRPERLEAVRKILEATMEDELTAQVMAGLAGILAWCALFMTAHTVDPIPVPETRLRVSAGMRCPQRGHPRRQFAGTGNRVGPDLVLPDGDHRPAL